MYVGECSQAGHGKANGTLDKAKDSLAIRTWGYLLAWIHERGRCTQDAVTSAVVKSVDHKSGKNAPWLNWVPLDHSRQKRAIDCAGGLIGERRDARDGNVSMKGCICTLTRRCI